MVMKKRARGSVNRSLRAGYRYKTDEEFRERRKNIKREYYHRNKEKFRERKRKYVQELNEFADKRCKKCNKLLNYTTKGEYCRKHMKGRPKGSKNKEIKK